MNTPPLFWINLQAISPKENKYRAYTIMVWQKEGSEEYSVLCNWGKVGAKSQRKLEHFDNREELDKFIIDTLKIRFKHGYVISGQSINIPNYSILQDFEIDKPFPKEQLQLFKS